MKSLQEAHAQVLKNIHQNIGKPTIVEAQRILRILDGLYDSLITFMYLDTEFIARFLGTGKNKLPEDQVKKLSKQGYELLYNQAELEAKYKPYASMLDQASNSVPRATQFLSICVRGERSFLASASSIQSNNTRARKRHFTRVSLLRALCRIALHST